MTPEDLEQIRQIVQASHERAMTAIADEFTDMRADIGRLRADVQRELKSMQTRLDNLAPVIVSAASNMAAFTRSMDQLIGAHHETESTQAAQQIAIDQLAARVARIEKELHPEP